MFECKNCRGQFSTLEEFPGRICLECYKLTPAAHAPLTAHSVASMWGAR